MASYLIAYAITKKIEGLYDNNPNDKGGETYKGIARNYHPSWPGWAIIDAGKSSAAFPKNLALAPKLQDMVLAFYKKNFWDIHQLDSCKNQAIANELFDTGVNMGPEVAANFCQRSLNALNRRQKDYKDTALDNQIGPATMALINSHPRPHKLLLALNLLQGAKYIALAEKNESQEDFINGWLERVAA